LTLIRYVGLASGPMAKPVTLASRAIFIGRPGTVIIAFDFATNLNHNATDRRGGAAECARATLAALLVRGVGRAG
jgi:hypothetical protein